MDIQEYLANATKAARARTLATSDQLTLGEMILKLEAIAQKGYKLNDGTEPTVRYDFEYLFPNDIDSWRGSYDELALNFKSEGEPMTLTAFLEMLKSTVGKEFTGYKGGEYVMNKHTPVWVANYSHSGNTAVVEIVDNGYTVILMTAYREF